MVDVLKVARQQIHGSTSHILPYISSFLQQELDHFQVLPVDGNMEEELSGCLGGGRGRRDGSADGSGGPPAAEELVVVTVVRVRGRLVLDIHVQPSLCYHGNRGVPTGTRQSGVV